MNRKQRTTLAWVFEHPERCDIDWREIESLLRALGAEISEGRGSRVRVALQGVRAVFHRPHPKRTASKAQVRSVRRFLTRAEVTP